jgi:predicted site-specific integrase-resolvase
MLTDMTKRLVPTSDAAEEIGVSTATLLRWVKEGKITPTDETLGHHYRWDLDDLRAQLRERKADQ